jgi:hypothetical protein
LGQGINPERVILSQIIIDANFNPERVTLFQGDIIPG